MSDLSLKQVIQLAECLGAESKSSTIDHGFSIVVLDRGFVYVGDVVTDEAWCTITNCRNIRAWGTKKGLGELAINGPQQSTVLDSIETVTAPLRALISIIKCRSRWS